MQGMPGLEAIFSSMRSCIKNRMCCRCPALRRFFVVLFFFLQPKIRGGQPCIKDLCPGVGAKNWWRQPYITNLICDKPRSEN